MDWHDIAVWVSSVVAFVLAVDRIAGRFVARKYATIDELSGVERVLSDRCNDQEKAVIAMRGELRALPTSMQMEEIRKDVGEVKTTQARTDERVEAVREDVHEMRRMLEQAMQARGRT